MSKRRIIIKYHTIPFDDTNDCEKTRLKRDREPSEYVIWDRSTEEYNFIDVINAINEECFDNKTLPIYDSITQTGGIKNV